MKRKNCKVKDSKQELHINVKPVDTQNAVCKDHQKCVIAKAVLRQTKAEWVDVGASTVLVGVSKTLARRFLLSAKAREQIRFFDTTGKFAPCVVDLRAPKKQETLGNRTGANARSGQRKNKSSGKVRQIPSR